MNVKTLAISVILLVMVSCDIISSNSVQDNNALSSAPYLTTDNTGLSITKAIIRTVHGNIEFKFYPIQAPTTVTRIIQLIKSDFYNGLTFFKVYPNFIIQTGDPTNTGKGGSGQKLKAEFNDIQHVKGTVAMARGQEVDSADSQFYIALTTLSHLDKKYTVFGQVIKGLDILEKITQNDKILSISLKE